MIINKDRNDSTLTISLTGRLETTTSPELEEVVKTELDGVTLLIFDFSELDYISSAGLRVLLTAQKIMNRQGAMKVKNINDIVSEVFDVTGFTDILTIE